MPDPNADWEEFPGLSKSVRPRLQMERTKFENICETAAGALLLSLILYMTQSWSALPAKIPTHFNLAGQADAWGDKHTILILLGVAGVLYVGLSILQQFPHVYNYAFKLTSENVRRQYLLARQLLTVIKLEVVGCLSFISWQIIQVSKGEAHGLQPWLVPILILIIFGTLAVYIVKAKRAV